MLNSGFLIEINHQWNSAMDAEEDNMGDTAVTFILLFLITLLFTIGTTAFKVMSLCCMLDVWTGLCLTPPKKGN